MLIVGLVVWAIGAAAGESGWMGTAMLIFADGFESGDTSAW